MASGVKLPNFFIVGAPRAGTTSIYDFLRRTEGIYMSPRKETNYLSGIDPAFLSPPPIRDRKKYQSLFRGVKDEKAIGEASPIYLRDPQSPELIRKVCTDPKIVISLRNPVERAYSQYLLRKSNGLTYSFSEAITIALDAGENDFKARVINGGMYYEQVKRYVDAFGRDNVKIVVFEEFVKDPRQTVQQIIDFLGVDAEAPEAVDLPHNILAEPRNRVALALLQSHAMRRLGRRLIGQRLGDVIIKKILGKKIPKPEMDEGDRRRLYRIYESDMKKLESFLGIVFP